MTKNNLEKSFVNYDPNKEFIHIIPNSYKSIQNRHRNFKKGEK